MTFGAFPTPNQKLLQRATGMPTYFRFFLLSEVGVIGAKW